MKKITVMIVDDEKLVIEDLMTLVDWGALGFEIVATAVNGKQALSKFQQCHPQVVFTDIKMPFMDGIELTGYLREMDTQTQILLLTAYEDFEYARNAIHYQVTDYVIKSTINPKTFTELLARLRMIIDSQSEVKDIVKDKMIADYFVSSDESEYMKDKELFTRPYLYLMIEQDMPINLVGDNGLEMLICPKKDVISAITGSDNRNFEIVAISNISRGRILLVLDTKNSSQTAIYHSLFQYSREIKEKLKDLLKKDFSIYMVNKKAGLAELKRFYATNCQAFYQKYLTGCRGIFFLEDYKPMPLHQEEVVLDTEHIHELLDKLDGQGIRCYLEELFRAIGTSGNYKNLCAVSMELYDFLKRNYKQLPDYTQKSDLSAENNWYFWLDAKQLQEWFIYRFSTLIYEKERIYQHGYSKAIMRVIEYIYHNYSDSGLTIKDIADYVHISAGHLCGLFKRETGKTLNNYITEVRILEAKNLLDEGKLKVYEISEAVGYQSSQYFSQIFYKLVGSYPTEYQKGKRVDSGV